MSLDPMPVPAHSSARVLVAEDNDDIRALICTLLTSAGIDVVEAVDGTEAIDALEANALDLALLDVEMPGVGGYEVLGAMRASATHHDTPVLFVTARGAPQQVIEGLELGASDYLTKPFNGQELVARTQSALRVKAAADSLRISNLQLQDAACRDGLTGIHNRRHLDEQLHAMGSTAARHRRSLGVLMIDVDRFKVINDVYGHPAGDDVLRGVAELLSTQARTEDVVGRYGGEEFLFLLPDTDLAGSFNLGERVRLAIAATAFTIGEKELLDVTVSVGCASQIGGDVYTLVAAADRALYEAKSGGRNACVRAVAFAPEIGSAVHQ
jgi:two-component system cell cycle response regulator